MESDTVTPRRYVAVQWLPSAAGQSGPSPSSTSQSGTSQSGISQSGVAIQTGLSNQPLAVVIVSPLLVVCELRGPEYAVFSPPPPPPLAAVVVGGAPPPPPAVPPFCENGTPSPYRWPQYLPSSMLSSKNICKTTIQIRHLQTPHNIKKKTCIKIKIVHQNKNCASFCLY